MPQSIKQFFEPSTMLVTAKVLSITSVGLFAGSAHAYTIFIMPALRQFGASSSVAVWSEMYPKAKRAQVSHLVVCSLAGAYVYQKTKNPYFLYGSALAFAIIPFTVGLMYPINKKLITMHKTKQMAPEHEVEDLMQRWEVFHFVRVVSSTTALLLLVYGVVGSSWKLRL